VFGKPRETFFFVETSGVEARFGVLGHAGCADPSRFPSLYWVTSMYLGHQRRMSAVFSQGKQWAISFPIAYPANKTLPPGRSFRRYRENSADAGLDLGLKVLAWRIGASNTLDMPRNVR
jgi:hypothetical protein